MVELLGQVSQGHEMYCHDLEVMDLNHSRVKLGCMERLSKSYFNQKYQGKGNVGRILRYV